MAVAQVTRLQHKKVSNEPPRIHGMGVCGLDDDVLKFPRTGLRPKLRISWGSSRAIPSGQAQLSSSSLTMLISANENLLTPTVDEIEARRKAAMFFSPAFSDMIRGQAGASDLAVIWSIFRGSRVTNILYYSSLPYENNCIVIVVPVTSAPRGLQFGGRMRPFSLHSSFAHK